MKSLFIGMALSFVRRNLSNLFDKPDHIAIVKEIHAEAQRRIDAGTFTKRDDDESD